MQRTPRLLLGSLALLALAGVGLSQGADNCAMAQPIAGTGMFNFDNTSATTDGLPDGLCLAFGSSQIDNDVWFEWTPAVDSVYEVATCGGTTVDTKIAAYSGGCGGTVEACNDDSCGLQSAISFIGTGGTTYTLRIGTFPGATGGTGTFTVTDIGFPQVLDTQINPANGHTYHFLEFSSWTIAQATALTLGGNLATVNDQAENDWLNATFHMWGGQNRSFWIGYNDEALEGTFEWVSGQTPGYENWSAGEPNDSTGLEDYAHFRSDWGNGTWNDLLDDPSGGFYSEVHGVVELDGSLFPGFCYGDGTGTPCPCGNTGGTGEGCANGSGVGALLVPSGSDSVMADDLAFECFQMLPFQPALLFVGQTALNGGNGIPFGDGLRCAGMNVVRLGIETPDANGQASWGPGLGSIGGWAPGDARYFQAWYRDPFSSPCGFLFNLSHGIEVNFTN